MAVRLVQNIRAYSNRDFIREQDLDLLFEGASPAARNNQLSRAVSAGDLIRLRRGVYYLNKQHQRHGVNFYELANLLYVPSYVSLESALAFYGLIPEAVFSITSITPRNDTKFENPLGVFSYRRIAKQAFQVGFVRIEEEPHHYLMANPLKALLDTVYIHKRIYSRLSDLEEDLRVDLESLYKQIRPLKNQEILTYEKIYKGKAIKKLIHLLLWELL